MPRIPGPVEPRGPAPVIDFPRPREVSPAPVGLADLGAALTDEGAALLEFAVTQERSAEATRIKTEAERLWGELRNDADAAGTAAEARRLWGERAPQVRDQLARLAQERNLGDLLPDLEALAQQNALEAHSSFTRRAAREGVDAAQAYANAKLESYVNAASDVEAQRHKVDLHRELQRVAETNPLFSPGDADVLFQATMAEAGRRRLNARISAAVASRDLGTLRQLAGVVDGIPDLPSDLREAARATIVSSIEQVEAHLRAEAHRRGAVAASNLFVGIFNATDPAEIDSILQEADRLFEAGMIPPDTRTNLHRNGVAKRAALLEDALERADVMMRLNMGFGLNSQKEADLAYEAEAAEIPPERSLEHLIEFTIRAGVPPSDGANLLKRAERMDHPDQLATAAKYLRGVQDRAPAAATMLNVGPRVETVVAYAKAFGMTEDEAARLVIDQTPDAAVLERRAEQFDAAFEDFDPLRFLQHHDISPTYWFRADAEVRDQILIETENTLRRVWEMTGSKEAAEQAAADALRRRFQVTQVGGGRERLAEIPAELFGVMAFQGNIEPELVARAVDSEIEQLLGEAGIELPDPPAGLENTPKWELRTDDRTRAELAAGKPPSWQLWVRGDEFGNMRRIPDPDAQPGDDPYVRYRMPTYEELRALEPVREAAIESFREGLRRQFTAAQAEVHRLESERLLLIPQASAGIEGARERLDAVEVELEEAKRRLEEARTRLGP